MATIGPSRLSGVVLGFLRSAPWRSIVLDLAFVVAWVGATSFVFESADWPTWLYYVVAFAGVVVYSLGISPVLSRRDG